MVYTVTLNPSLDYVIGMEKMRIGKINRVEDELIHVGGKGINVSLILKELGVKSIAMGFVAGFTGMEVKRQLIEKEIATQFIEASSGMTRINVKLREKTETDINGMGPCISKENLEQLMAQLNQCGPEDVLVLAGSVPKSLPRNTYEQILNHLKDKKLKVVVDTTGESLRKTFSYRPFLVKPNLEELGELFSTTIESKQDVISYAKKVQEMGAKNILVSLSSKGALLLTENGDIIESKAHRGIVRNTVGAGDSMVAGFLNGYLSTNDYRYALQMGASAGSATAFSNGLGSGDRIMELMNRNVVL